MKIHQCIVKQVDILRDHICIIIGSRPREEQKCRGRTQKYIAVVQVRGGNDLLQSGEGKEGKMLIGLD